MSRSGYSDDCDGWALIRWRGAVNSAIKGKRGQAFLREVLATLDAMPEKRLVADSFHDQVEGQFCTLGAVGAARGLDMAPLEDADREYVAKAFGITQALAAEIMYENDGFQGHDEYILVDVEICGPMRRPKQHCQSHLMPNPHAAMNRWSRMRAWIVSHIKEPA